MKVIVILYWALLVNLFSPTLGASQEATKKAKREVKIGALLPLTGDGAFWGENARQGILMALEALEEREDVDFSLRVIFEDDQCDPRSAVSAFRKLSEIDGVRHFIGPICSSATIAVGTLAQRSKSLLITPCSEADAISELGDFIFRTWTPNGIQARRAARYLREDLKVKRVAVVSVQNEFAESISRRFVDEFTRSGGEITRIEEYDAVIDDFRPMLLRLRRTNPEAIYLISYIPDGIRLVRQIRGLGITVPLVGSSTFNSPDFIGNLGDAAEGMVLTDLEDLSTSDFRQRFSERWNKDWPGVSGCAATAYDNTFLLFEAISKVGEEPYGIRDFFQALRDYPGVSGPITFDKNGDLARTHRMFVIRDGRLQMLE